MTLNALPAAVRLKLDLMFEGIRYSEALGAAAAEAYPNFVPYRFRPGEANPTGKDKVPIPYLLTTEDGTLVRVRGNGASRWTIDGEPGTGYRLSRDGGPSQRVRFDPLPGWMGRQTSDGFPMARAGVGLLGDMAVVNIAPGCQYFAADKQQGRSMRCTFCTYGAPDGRMAPLGQQLERAELPELSYRRLRETLRAVLAERRIGHVYLVGGSLTDWHQEGRRFVEIARQAQQVLEHRVPLTCGSGALPQESLRQLHDEGLVDNVCFNLEVWSEPLFAKVCPGKHRFVGYRRWIESLEAAVALWGAGRVYSAMVAGVELEPEHGLSWQQAAQLALQGAQELCARGVLPIYSLYWPTGGRDHPEHLANLLAFFEKLNSGYHAVRQARGLHISAGLQCHRCAYMQIECDLDRNHQAAQDAP